MQIKLWWILRQAGSSNWLKRQKAAKELGLFTDWQAAQTLVNLLKDPQQFVRAEASNSLKRIHTGAAVQPLILALADDYYVVRNNAKEALKAIAPEWHKSEDARQVVPQLIVTLRGESAQPREGAAHALDCIGDKRAMPQLIIALDDWDPMVRRNAASALKHVGDVTSAKPLLKACRDSDERVRSLARSALEQVADVSILPEILLTFTEERDANLRRLLADLLGQFGGLPAIEPLALVLVDPDNDVRTAAGIALARIHPQWAHTHLVRSLVPFFETALTERKGRQERKAAIEVLSQISAKDAFRSLGMALLDPDNDVRAAAVAALSKIDPTVGSDWKTSEGLKRLMPSFIAALKGARAQAAIEILETLRDPQAIKPLVLLLTGLDEKLRKSAAAALDKIDPCWLTAGRASSAIPSLVSVLTSHGATGRELAAATLESLGWCPEDDLQNISFLVGRKDLSGLESIGIPAIAPLLHIWDRSEDTAETRIVRKAIQAIGSSSTKLFLEIARDRIRHTHHYKEKANALYSIGLLGTDALPSLPELIDALSDAEPDVRRSAIYSIGQIGPTAVAAVPHLMNTWCQPRGFTAFEPNVALALGIKDRRIVDPLLNAFFSLPRNDNDQTLRNRYLEMMRNVTQSTGLTRQIVELINQVNSYEHVSVYRYETGQIKTEASFTAVRQLSSINSSVSSNILHLIVQLRDYSFSYWTGCSSVDLHVTYETQRRSAQQELHRRGDPPYKPEAYLEL